MTICEYQGTLGEWSSWGAKDPAVTLVHFLAAIAGGSAVVPGGGGDSLAGTCALGGGKGSFGSSCSSVVTGGSNVILGPGQGPVMGSCSVSGSVSSSSCHTILKKTVESSLKTSITY